MKKYNSEQAREYFDKEIPFKIKGKKATYFHTGGFLGKVENGMGYVYVNGGWAEC